VGHFLTARARGGEEMTEKRETEYISMKEAAKVLRISYSTAWRYFEEGILIGEKHPITG